MKRIVLRSVGEKHLPLQRQCNLVLELGFYSQMDLSSNSAYITDELLDNEQVA